MTALLALNALTVAYGKLHAVQDVSLQVAQGERVCLIGANGAGKSTLLKTVGGLLQPRSGSIHFASQSIGSLPGHAIVARGLALVPEGRGIFNRLSVLENLELGAWLRRDRAAVRQEIATICERFPRLGERRNQPAGQLSGGEQQLLAIQRALLSRPRLLLLDEPSMGLAPMMVEAVFSSLLDAHRGGITLLLVEQNAQLALTHTDRGYVMESGRITMENTSAALHDDPQVRAAYLGVGSL
ncbi:MAG: ABC transporter ATP-binding protein [Betaproteobacteria bacterium]|nr:ABC transporter ATP-binding protein [Betaproteobacteria bacterium]